MVKTQKHAAAVILLFFMILSSISTTATVQAAPEKLSAKDFIFTVSGKKKDFLKESKESQAYFYIMYQHTDMKKQEIKTSRSVTFGSTAAFVKKKYGNRSQKEINIKEVFYKRVKADVNLGMANYPQWKSYLEYNYKKGGDSYKIRFYLDKKNKVTSVVYLKNPADFYEYPDKTVKSGLTFLAPKGKKITTKMIDGKKVYVFPKDAKIYFKKDAITKSKFENLVLQIYTYNEDDEIVLALNENCGAVPWRTMKDLKWKQGKSYDLQDDFTDHVGFGIYTESEKKSAPYIRMVVHRQDQKLSPEVFYFTWEGIFYLGR